MQSDDVNVQWGKDCPRTCNCKNTDFIDLPIVKWMNNGIKPEQETHNSNIQNEVPNVLQQLITIKKLCTVFKR